MKILVIEDCASTLLLLKNIISTTFPSVELHTARTADIAVKLWNEVQPDLVMLDMSLEERTAMDVLKNIIDNKARIIFTTGRVGIENIVNTVKFVDKVFTKPYLIEELKTYLQNYMDNENENNK